MAALQFELQHTDKNSKARAGKITTDHGEITSQNHNQKFSPMLIIR
jgi:hypothetical protein